MKFIKELINDKEYQDIKTEWKNITSEPFPLYNFEQYRDTEDFKNKVRIRLEKIKDNMS